MKQKNGTNDTNVTVNELGTGRIETLILRFAIPCVIALLINSLYNIVDQIFIGRGVGYLGNGATNVVFPITIIALAFSLMIGDGGAAWLSLKLGEGKEKEAKRGVGIALLLSVIAGVFLLVVTWIFLKPMIYAFGCTDVIYPYAMEYGRMIVVGLPFTMISTSFNSIIRADGNPKYAMFSMMIGCILNIILDPIFIFVLHWGVFGAAFATVIGQLASFFVSVMYLRKFQTISLQKKDFMLEHRVVRSILAFGISSFITQFAIVAVMAVTNNMLKKYGSLSKYGAEIPITAMGITMKVNQIMIAIVVGIASGAQPIIGYNYGARKYDRVKKTLFLSILAATVITIVCFLVFQFAPMAVIRLFGSEDALYNEFAVKCFRIFLLTCVLNGFQTIAAIFVQAIGKPLKSAFISLSRQIIFFVPAALILPLYMNIEGVLWAGPVADILAFISAILIIGYEVIKMNESKYLS